MEIILIVGFGAVLFLMLCIGGSILEAIKGGRKNTANEEITVLVVFHCVAASGGEIFQSEECVIKGDDADLVLVHIEAKKRELAGKYKLPIIVHQIVKM